MLILGFAALPLSIGIGILKYRLYEIDRLISRTLAYAIVTGLLVGVYAGLVLLSTHVLTVHGTVAVAASTLAAAALFTPLRRRVQHAVDRRFNRARYDADQTIAAFSTHLKDAVDLDSVRTDLTAVVHRVLEPAHVSLWPTPRTKGAAQVPAVRHGTAGVFPTIRRADRPQHPAVAPAAARPARPAAPARPLRPLNDRRPSCKGTLTWPDVRVLAVPPVPLR